MPPDVAFTPEDLKMCNEGSAPLRTARQKKILDTLSELGFIVSHMDGYMGVRTTDPHLTPPSSRFKHPDRIIPIVEFQSAYGIIFNALLGS